MEINGTLVWYYHICKREVWLMSRHIAPDEYDTNIDIGRFLHQISYGRNKKEIHFGNVKFDVLIKDKNKIVIGETKKTSKFETASKYQLLYYLRIMKEAGLEATGVLLYPEERKRIDVVLSKEACDELDRIVEDINSILILDSPPGVTKTKYCKTCGYREYCFA